MNYKKTIFPKKFRDFSINPLVSDYWNNTVSDFNLLLLASSLLISSSLLLLPCLGWHTWVSGVPSVAGAPAIAGISAFADVPALSGVPAVWASLLFWHGALPAVSTTMLLQDPCCVWRPYNAAIPSVADVPAVVGVHDILVSPVPLQALVSLLFLTSLLLLSLLFLASLLLVVSMLSQTFLLRLCPCYCCRPFHSCYLWCLQSSLSFSLHTLACTVHSTFRVNKISNYYCISGRRTRKLSDYQISG